MSFIIIPSSGGGGSPPGGADRSIQFNNAGVFGGASEEAGNFRYIAPFGPGSETVELTGQFQGTGAIFTETEFATSSGGDDSARLDPQALSFDNSFVPVAVRIEGANLTGSVASGASDGSFRVVVDGLDRRIPYYI